MLKPKKKITKREIKEDKLVTTYFELRQWIDQNRKRVSSVSFMVIIAAAATWFYEGLPAGASIPWVSWMVPLAWWLLFVAAAAWTIAYSALTWYAPRGTSTALRTEAMMSR